MLYEYVPLALQYRQGAVQRCALARKIHGYDLRQHSYGVFCIVLDLCGILGIDPPNALQSRQILMHDLMEVFTGDLPHSVKALSGETERAWDTIEQVVAGSAPAECLLGMFTDRAIEKSLGRSLYMVFRLADTLDLLIYAYEETSLGNASREMLDILKNASDRTAQWVRQIAESLAEEGADYADELCYYIASSDYVSYESLMEKVREASC